MGAFLGLTIALNAVHGGGDVLPSGPEPLVPIALAETSTFGAAQVNVFQTSFSIQYPTGIEAGDLIMLFWQTGDGFAMDLPTGFTLGDESIRNGTAGGWYYKIADGTEAGDLTVTFSDAVKLTAFMARFTGVDPANPINANARLSSTSAQISGNLPDITPIVENSLVIYSVGTDRGANANPFASGWDADLTEIYDNENASLGTGARASSLASAISEPNQPANIARPGGQINFNLSGAALWDSWGVSLSPKTSSPPQPPPPPSFISLSPQTAVVGTGTSRTIPWPADIQAGDFILLGWHVGANIPMDLPPGFTLGAVEPGSPFLTFGGWYYKIADGTESGDLTVTFPGNVKMAAFLARFSGVDPTNPVNASVLNRPPGVTTQALIPDITPTVDNSRLVRFVGVDRGNNGAPAVAGWPADYTEIHNNQDGPDGTGTGSAAIAAAISNDGVPANVTVIGSETGLTYGLDVYWYSWALALTPDPNQ